MIAKGSACKKYPGYVSKKKYWNVISSGKYTYLPSTCYIEILISICIGGNVDCRQCCLHERSINYMNRQPVLFRLYPCCSLGRSKNCCKNGYSRTCCNLILWTNVSWCTQHLFFFFDSALIQSNTTIASSPPTLSHYAFRAFFTYTTIWNHKQVTTF